MELVRCDAQREVILDEVRSRVNGIQDQLELVIIQVEGDQASDVYVRNKIKTCNSVGIKPTIVRCDNRITYTELLGLISRYNAMDHVTGLMLQLPLPQHLKGYEQNLLDCISWWKDVDGLSTQSVGRLWNGKECITPATATGILSLFDKDLRGKNVTIVGRSALVGKPLAKLLMDRNATVTICHGRTGDLAAHFVYADAVVIAIGKPKFIDSSFVPKYSSVGIWVDVGINRDDDGKLCGDIDPVEFEGIETTITAVPGGVGLLTTAQLMMNVVKAYDFQSRFAKGDLSV